MLFLPAIESIQRFFGIVRVPAVAVSAFGGDFVYVVVDAFVAIAKDGRVCSG